MQKLIQFIRKTSVAIVFIILEIIAIRSYAYSTPYTQARLLVWSNNVVGYFHSAFSNITSYFGLREENSRLTDHIAELENRIRTLEQAIPAEKIDYLVTDSGASPESVALCRAKGIEVLIADV